MGLLLFFFGISFLFLILVVSIRDDSYLNPACISKSSTIAKLELGTYPLDWTKAFEFPSEVIFRGIVAQPCHEQRLERITSDLWVLRQL